MVNMLGFAPLGTHGEIHQIEGPTYWRLVFYACALLDVGCGFAVHRAIG
jgi:hypothetical protein